MDETDRKLLALLQQQGKRTVKYYASQTGLSTTAVYERIKRLENSGVVTGYVALVDKKKVNRQFTVFCHIRLSQHNKQYLLQFEKEVHQLEEVVACYHISGDYDYILKVHVQDMDAYREFMVTKLTALSNIGSTQSSIVINEVKYSTALAI